MADYINLANFLLELDIGRSVRVVAHEADRSARWRTAFLYETTFAFRKEGRELRGGPGWKLKLQHVQHFRPSQTTAVDHAVSRLDLFHLTDPDAATTKADLIQTYDHRRAAVNHDKRGHVLRNAGHTTDHRQSADAAKLMYCHTTSKVRPLIDSHMAAEHSVVSQDDVVAHHAVMSHVGANHEQATIAHAGNVPGFHRPVNSYILSEDVTVSNNYTARMLWHADVLRHAAQDDSVQNLIISAKLRAGFDRDSTGQATIVA